MDIFPSNWYTGVFNFASGYASTENSGHSLVRRGFRASWHVSVHSSSTTSTVEESGFQWRFLLVFVTAFIASILFILVSYTFKVILTLCVIEDSPAVYLPLESEDLLDERSRKPAAVLGLDNPKVYITNSIRGTIHHLRSEAGTLSLWRGWGAHIAYVFTIAIVRAVIYGIFSAFIPGFVARPVAEILSPLLLVRFSMTITHIIISKEQPNTMWFSRVLATPWSDARRTIPSMAHLSLATTVAYELGHYSMNQEIHVVARAVLFIASTFTSFFITFPIMVALFRVQASLLPDNQDGIITFDRSFGKSDNTMGLSFGEALKSVGCAGWKRIAKLVAKFLGVMAGLSVVCGGIIGLEMLLVMHGAKKVISHN